MAKIFISYSSKDKKFARQLAEDLSQIGHKPWLDEWEIKVGECIPTKIQKGLDDSDYLILVLSEHSIQSGWVDREWKDKYWEESEKGQVLILPVLIQDCDIPRLLKTKRYADFRISYAVGFSCLVASIDPVINQNESFASEVSKNTKYLVNLIQKAQSSNNKLSQLIAETLSFALENNNTELAEWCKVELSGYQNSEIENLPTYRYLNVFASLSLINMQYIGWDGNASTALNYMEADSKNFVPQKLAITIPISEIEDQVSHIKVNSLMYVTKPYVGKVPKGKQRPNVNLYGSGDSFLRILSAIRSELSRKLIELLPSVNNP